jgi:hypothetical protein
MKNKHTILLGGSGDSERVENDLYETPEFFTDELLKKETFHNNILEPACGNGRISKTLIEHNYNVYSTDLIKRDFECEQKDFLTSDFESNKYDIITNPPYALMFEFIQKASIVAKNKFAFVGRIQLLEGVKRYNYVYKRGINGFKLKKVLVSVRRLNFISTSSFINQHTSAMTTCWFVFEKNYNDLPQVDWINL